MIRINLLPHREARRKQKQAAFVAMLYPHLVRRRARLAAAIGGAICLIAIPFSPVGLPVLLSGVAIFVGVPASGDES